MRTKYGIPAHQVLAKNTKIKATDDFYVLQRKKSPLNDMIFLCAMRMAASPSFGPVMTWKLNHSARQKSVMRPL
jgi:hypothetical protein